MVAAVCLAVGLAIATPTASQAEDVLTLAITPAKVAAGPGISMRWVIRNAATKAVDSLKVSADLPAGMRLDVDDPRVVRVNDSTFRIPGPLAPGGGIALPVSLDKTPAVYPTTIVALVHGRVDGAPVAATGSFEVTQPPPLATLTLTGGGKMTDSSSVELRARLVNISNLAIHVGVVVSAGRHEATVSTTAGSESTARSVGVDISPGESKDVFVRAQGGKRVKTETASVYVDATVTADGAEATHLSAAKDVEVSMAGSDLLPNALGVGSALLVPGLVGMWAFLDVRRKDRKDRGLEATPTAKEMWDDKIWLLAGALLSVGAIYVAAPILGVNLLDEFNLKDLLVITAGTTLVAALVSFGVVLLQRRGATSVTVETNEIDVLGAAAKADGAYIREKYETSDKKVGLLVRKQGDAYVLMPQILYSRPAHRDAADHNDLAAALAVIKAAADFNGAYTQDPAWIPCPAAYVSAQRAGEEACLKFDATLG